MKKQWLKKVIAVGVLALGLTIGGVATTLHAEAAGRCQTYDGSNEDEQNYSRWSDTVKSYLDVCTDGSLMRVQAGATDNGILVEYYDGKYNFKRSKTVIAGMLPIFGGFYADGSYYYVLSGQMNREENNSVEVYRITKFDQNWNVVGYDGIYGANTCVPFSAGSARMTSSGSYLFVRTCHQMYKSKDGYNHQANVTIQFNINTNKITDSFTSVAYSGLGYVSHSFNQFIRTDGTSIVGVDHGDAYPRSVCLLKYNTDFTSGKFTPGYYNTCSEATMLSISGAEGDNTTGASVGGFEISGNNYLVVGNSINQASQSNSTRNIYVSVVPRNLSTAVSTRFLTAYPEGSTSASTPQFVKINADRFVIIWTKDDKVCYTEIDGNGNKVGNTYSFNGKLSDCTPVVYNNKLVWYTWNNGNIDFYNIDLSAMSKNSVTRIVNGHDFKTTYANGKTNIATQVCKVCGYKIEFTTPTEVGDVWWRKNADTGYFWYNCPTSFDVGDTLDIWHIYSGAETNKEFEVVLSDKTAASCTTGTDGLWRIKMLKTGNLKITIRAKYNPSVKKEFSVKIGHSYGNWTVSKAATYTETGIQTRTCSGCGAVESQTIPRKTLGKVKISSVSNTGNGVKVKWSAVSGAKGYYLYRKAGTGKYKKLATANDGKTVAYLDQTAANGASYTYKVVAFAGTNTGKASTAKKVYVSVPKSLKVSSKKAGRLDVSWKKNSKASGYQIQYSTNKKFSGAKKVTVKTGKKVKTTISGLKKGKKYYVRIRAYKKVSGKNNYSAWSKNQKVTIRK